MSWKWSFDFYYSLPFWAALVVVACLVRLAGARSPALRRILLLASSSALLLALPRFGPIDLLLVWIISAVAFVAATLLARDKERSSRWRLAWTTAGIVAVLGFLAFFKYHFLQDLLVGPWRTAGGRTPPGAAEYLFLLGASYFSFKAIHVVIETSKGTIREIEPLAFFNYMTFFPSFISGPISRYPDFSGQMTAARGELGADLRAGGERIVHGLFKKFVLVPIVFPYVLPDQADALSKVTPAGAVLGLYAYALYFFLDFSAYTDLAIGGARLVGVSLPENFNKPFFQKNIRDLWSSWHMSLTSWLVDYIYWPVVRRLRELEYFRTRPVLLSVVGMNVTFIACGIWHGEAPHFVLWGLFHGLGISIVNVYQRQKKKIRNATVQRYFQSSLSRWVGAFGTFNFFAAGLALFVLDTSKLERLFAALVR